MTRFRAAFALCAALASLAFCAPAFAADAAPAPTTLTIADLIRLPDAQLAAGLARAQAAGVFGEATVQCIQGIMAYNATNPPKPILPTAPVNVVDGIVAAHLLANGFSTATFELLPHPIQLACGGYAIEVVRNFNLLALKVGARVASGGLFGFLN